MSGVGPASTGLRRVKRERLEDVESVVKTLEQLTGEQCWRTNGHLRRIRGALLGGAAARSRLWGLLDRLAVTNPQTKGLDVVKSAGRFAVAELCAIEELLEERRT